MYLILDLLYLVNEYLFPLVYYKSIYGTEVHSRATFKCVYKEANNYNNYWLYDYKTKKFFYENGYNLFNLFNFNFDNLFGLKFTSDNLSGSKIPKEFYFGMGQECICSSFEISKRHISFLKSKFRIN